MHSENKKKILALLPSPVMYGKERANITVYNILKKDYSVSVIINKDANENLKDALEDFSTHSIIIPSRTIRSMRLLRYFIGYVIGNIQLLFFLLTIKPNALMMCNEASFYDFYPALFFFRGKILYRLGDAPGFKHYSFKKYNTYVWYNYIVKRVNIIVCNAHFVKKKLEEAGRNNDNDVIIYNYPPLRKAHTKGEEDKYRLTNNKDYVSFGYIGQIIESKGVGHIIESAMQIIDKGYKAIFYLAGSMEYDRSFSNSLINSIPSKYSNYISFIGEIENLDTFFKNVDVLCIPSIKQEPLANVLSEAKLYSTPCIIYPSGGLPELVRHEVDGYICNFADVKSLIRGMEYYLNDFSLIRKHGAASYQSIEDLNLTKGQFEKNWVETIKSLFL